MHRTISPSIVLGLAALAVGGWGQSFLVAAPRSARSNAGRRAAASKRIVATGPTNFSSQAGAFSVYFPAVPKQTRTQKSPLYICKVGSMTYAVDSGPTPPHPNMDMTAPAASAMLKKTFDSTQSRLIKSMNGQLQTSRDVVLQGVPGRQYTASAIIKGVPFLCTMHLYVAPKFTYLVMAMGTKKDYRAQRAQIDKFLGSFRPLGAPRWRAH